MNTATVEFGDLPKTISGKIRRVELRGQETSRAASPRGGRPVLSLGRVWAGAF